jgi:hypothetical protein
MVGSGSSELVNPSTQRNERLSCTTTECEQSLVKPKLIERIIVTLLLQYVLCTCLLHVIIAYNLYFKTRRLASLESELARTKTGTTNTIGPTILT